MPVIEGFETRPGAPGSVVILRRGWGARIPPGLLDDPEALLSGAAAPSAGRGALARIALEAGSALILKKYRRGGALRAVLPDLFAGTRRMRDDLAASERARARGVPCAAAVGLVLVRAAGPFWSGYLLTEEIPGAVTLDHALASESDPRARAASAVRTVRRLHDAGVLHRDLNLRNLLVARDEVYVIDLDGARVVASPTSAQRFGNLSRLDRSYVKIFRDGGPLTHDDRRALLDVYCGPDTEMARAFASRLDGHKRSLTRHARLWKT